jgi:hypothetical protein
VMYGLVLLRQSLRFPPLQAPDEVMEVVLLAGLSLEPSGHDAGSDADRLGQGSRLYRRLSWISAFVGGSQRAAPLIGAPLISRTKTTATPASAQSRCISGTNVSGLSTVSFLASSSAERNLERSYGLHSIFRAASSPRRSHAAVGPGLAAKAADLPKRASGRSQSRSHAWTSVTPKKESAARRRPGQAMAVK